MISFVVHGPPVAAARPRLSRGKTYDPRSAERKQVEAIIREELILRDWELTENLVGVHFEFYLKLPKAMERGFVQPVYHKSKQDIDNLCKLYLDAMNKLVWRDDNQVVELSACKLCSPTPYTQIMVQELV